MSALVSIIAPAHSSALARHEIHTLPVLVIFPHNQCNCRCMMCDIWRIPDPKQITPAALERQIAAFKTLKVSWVVFSGGEPQLNEKWSSLAQMVRSAGSRVTLLTAGLLLQPQAQIVADSVDDVIVSLDGPPPLHNLIRRVPRAFEQLADGVHALHQLRSNLPVRARCTVQKANHQSLRAVVHSAKTLGLASISFLAADLTSSAFNRPQGWAADRASRVALTLDEADALESEIEQLIHQHEDDFASKFIVESPQKLRRIVRHFRAHLHQAEDVSPRCNAPWVSAVIEASGDVRPCFFHPVVGNIHHQPLTEILNSPQALQFRSTLEIATNPTCKRCVCSLHIAQQENVTVQ